MNVYHEITLSYNCIGLWNDMKLLVLRVYGAPHLAFATEYVSDLLLSRLNFTSPVF